MRKGLGELEPRRQERTAELLKANVERRQVLEQLLKAEVGSLNYAEMFVQPSVTVAATSRLQISVASSTGDSHSRN